MILNVNDLLILYDSDMTSIYIFNNDLFSRKYLHPLFF